MAGTANCQTNKDIYKRLLEAIHSSAAHLSFLFVSPPTISSCPSKATLVGNIYRLFLELDTQFDPL